MLRRALPSLLPLALLLLPACPGPAPELPDAQPPTPADSGLPRDAGSSSPADAADTLPDGGADALDAAGGAPDGSATADAAEPPDASLHACAASTDCPVLACNAAACPAGACVYSPLDMDACAAGGKAGFCRAGECRTDVRHTRALAVITDFADRKLEDYLGQGFTSETDVRAATDEMEKHWWWASLGSHRSTWDVVRIQLPQTATAEAFADWAAFRDAAAEALLATVHASGYDADGDGLVDAAYFILATGPGTAPDWAMGGMSRHRRVNLFVDPQDGLSVRQRATGNFNHEFGHCLGLPDLYGTYGTIYWLSLMHDSWPLPPMGLSAYDRMRLGWMAPRQVTQTTQGVELTQAETSFSAVQIPGPRSESFLVEYRRRPASGYGSKAPAHDGLAVYHVLEGAAQAMNPPLLKLEPADGALVPGVEPQASDLFKAGSPAFVGKSYLTGEDVFRLENVQATATGGRKFDVVILGTGGTQPANLLRNASFESGTATAATDWTTSAWILLGDTFGREAMQCRDGSFAARILNSQANDASFQQTVSSLKAGTGYLFCGWLKGDQVVDVEGGGIGANVTLMSTWTQSSAPFGTFDWTRRCVAFAADGATATVGFRLGFYGSTVTGTAWADDLSFEELRPAF